MQNYKYDFIIRRGMVTRSTAKSLLKKTVYRFKHVIYIL
jgi:hypothetical protein